MLNIIVAKNGAKHEARFETSWHVDNETITDGSGSTSWQTVDVCFKALSRSADFSWLQESTDVALSIEVAGEQQRQPYEGDFGSAAAFNFVLECLAAATTSDFEHGSIVKLVVPRSRGYIARSDVIMQRLLDCLLIEKAASFAVPQQLFDGKPVSTKFVSGLFAASIGGVILRDKRMQQASGITSVNSATNGTTNGVNGHGESKKLNGDGRNMPIGPLSKSLDEELRNRLSFPWLSTQAPAGRRPTLAIVDGGLRGPEDGGTGGSIYLAAEALGIDMVVFDDPGHWVNGAKYKHWRKAFVPLELLLEPDAGFADSIANAVRSYEGHIDGILTFRDHYKLPVAEAAVKLGLHTYPPEAYAIATDKFKTSVSEGHKAYQAASAEEAVQIVQQHQLNYPLVIKPCNGFLSEGVHRVENLAQLEAGAQAINTERHGKEFVIEKYCEGPEVDVNLVLCDGEVIFFEASDDFPKGADANGQAGDVQNFIELANVLPSALPEDELTLLRNSLRESLIRMGFQDGFYHLEARVENSSMTYATKDGVLDLRKREHATEEVPPSSWLIEVNPRPPGIQESEAVRHTFGVDYFGLALLFALDNKERVKQLSHAYAQGPQYWCEMIFIPVEQGGVFDSDDVCGDLFARRPDLAEQISGSFCFLKKGDRVLDPLKSGINSWVAYFNVYSRQSRANLLKVAECVRHEVRFSIV